MNRCKPGDLCLIVRGIATGQCVTVEAQATREEVAAALSAKVGRAISAIDRGCVYWRIDKAIVWKDNHSDLCVYVPYEVDPFMLPINPKDDAKTREKDRQLEGV